MKVGDKVTLHSSEYKVLKSFQDVNSNDGSIFWNERMRIMLGKEFPVVEVKRDAVALSATMNNWNSGKVYFPKSVLRKSGE